MSFLSGLRKIGGYLANPGEVYGTNSDIGNVLNSVTGVNSQMDKSYQQQISAMDRQNAYNREMWDLQNQYNSPSAQLARMHDAGIDINPTSYALGTGNLSNTATFVGSEHGFAGSGSPAGNPISALMSIAQGVQGVRESKARTENISVQRSHTKIENDILRHNLKYAETHGLPVNSVPGTDASIAGLVNEAAEQGVWNTIKKYWSKNN